MERFPGKGSYEARDQVLSWVRAPALCLLISLGFLNFWCNHVAIITMHIQLKFVCENLTPKIAVDIGC